MMATYVFSVFLTSNESFHGLGFAATSFDGALARIQKTYGNDLSSVKLEKVTFSG
jgi:hypothetical protein